MEISQYSDDRTSRRTRRTCFRCGGSGLVAPYPLEPAGAGEECSWCAGAGTVESDPWRDTHCPRCGRVHPVAAACVDYDPFALDLLAVR